MKTALEREQEQMRERMKQRAAKKKEGKPRLTKQEILAELHAAKDDLICSSCSSRPATINEVTVQVDLCEVCRTRRSSLARYSINLDQYRKMLQDQNHCCAICNVHLLRPHVDHCHNRGHVRGALCGSCNTALGMFKDNPSNLIAAAIYLSRNRLSRKWWIQLKNLFLGESLCNAA